MSNIAINTVAEKVLSEISLIAITPVNPVKTELREQHLNAKKFIRTLAKVNHLHRVLESECFTPEQAQAKIEAAVTVKRLERALSVAAFCYGLPSDYAELEAHFTRATGRHSIPYCKTLLGPVNG